jgi:predicted MFS family arabinose efflux permease
MLPSYVAAWALLVFAWVGNYFIRMGLSALLPPIMRELDLSYTSAGVLATGFFYAYAVMQLPAGVLGDRFGRRRVLLIGLVVGALGAAATGLAGSFAALMATRLVVGAGQGCLFSNDRPIIAAVTPPEKIALGQALSFIGPGLGITLGFTVAAALGEVLPWRAVFVLFALPPLLAAVLIARFVPAPPPVARGAGPRRGLGRVLRSSDLWWLAVAGATAMWVMFTLATWAPLLFMERGVAQLARAGLYSSLQGLAAVAGLVISGWVGDAARRRGLTARSLVAGSLVGAALCMVAMAAVLRFEASAGALALTVFGASFFAWGVWAPSFVALGQVFPGAEASTAFGLYNSICVVGAVVGPGVSGALRDATGSFAGACLLGAVAAALGAVASTAVAARSPLDARL